MIDAVIEAALDPQPLEQALAGDRPDASPFEDAARGRGRGRSSSASSTSGGWCRASAPRFHEIDAPRRWPTATRSSRIFAAHRDRDHASSRSCAARLLRALTLSTTHPMLADEPTSPDELVRHCSCTASAERGAVMLSRCCGRTSRPYPRLLLLVVVLQTVQTSAALDAADDQRATSSTTACSPATTHYICTWGAVMLGVRARPGRVRRSPRCTSAARSR